MAFRYPSHLLISALLCITGGKCKVVRTSIGQDVVLPCDAGNITDPHMLILWSRTDLPPEQHVHAQRNGIELAQGQNPSYVGRTSFFQDEVKEGNMDLNLSRVQPSDEGNYTCKLPEINKESTVQLIVEPLRVGAVVDGVVILLCKTNTTVADATVEWRRDDLTPQNVHVISDGQEESALQNPDYRDRTSVSVDRVKDGDIVSLTISAVQLSDRGVYKCVITSELECVILLIVGSPEVYVYARKCNNPSTIILHCLATGFIFKDVSMDMMRNGRVLDELDGLQSTDVRPNGDDTFQIRKLVEILRSDSANFSCELKHPASNFIKAQGSDHSQPYEEVSGPNTIAIVGSAVLLLLLVVAAVIFYKKKRKEGKSETSSTRDSGLAAGDGPGVDGMDGIKVETRNKPDDKNSMDSGEASLQDDEMNTLNGSSGNVSSDSARGTSGDSTPESKSLLKDNEILCSENREGAMPMARLSTSTNEEIRVEEDDSRTALLSAAAAGLTTSSEQTGVCTVELHEPCPPSCALSSPGQPLCEGGVNPC